VRGARNHLIKRGRGYQFLEHPQIQGALALPPTVSVTRMNTGETVELFEGGWLALGEGLPSMSRIWLLFSLSWLSSSRWITPTVLLAVRPSRCASRGENPFYASEYEHW